MNDEVLISLNSVTVCYDDLPAIENVCLDVHKGDFMAVVGPNGGSKTTMFRTILGLITPTKGTVRAFGTSPSSACRRMGYVPQFGLFDRKYPITTEEVVRMGLRPKQPLFPFCCKNDNNNVKKVMEFAGIESLKDKRIGDLSGGQIQRALLARALVCKPEVLLLDEPTASLDPEMRGSVIEILEKTAENGVTVMMITHDIGSIDGKVNRIVHVDRTVKEIDVNKLQKQTQYGAIL